jgi:ribonuclease HII
MTGPVRSSTAFPDPVASDRSEARRGRSFSPTTAARDRRRPRWLRLRLDPDQAEEAWLRSIGHRAVAGVDEVGRGCLAGPVVAGAVILPSGWIPDGLRDSKLLKADERERLDVEIRANAVAWAVAAVGPDVIDRINILQATLLAAQLAAGRLSVRPDVLLFDGSLVLSDVLLPQRVIIDGDRLCASIAAASVVAKVARDRLMVELDTVYPGYGLASNKGYAAPEHRAGLEALGLAPIHRRTFASCAEVDQLGFWDASSDGDIAILPDVDPDDGDFEALDLGDAVDEDDPIVRG